MDDPDTSGLDLGDDFFDEDLEGDEHDLDGIFDVESDAVVTSGTNASDKAGLSKNLARGSGNGNDNSSEDKRRGSSKRNKGEKLNQKKRRRSSAAAAKAKDQAADGSAPAWHGDNDKPYRERMVGEM